MTDAKKAFDLLASTLDDLSQEALSTPTRNLRMVSVRGLRLFERVNHPQIKARFDLIPDSLFDPGHLPGLKLASLSAAHVHAELQRARGVDASERTSRLDPKLVMEGTTLRAKMLKVLDYNLGHLEDMGEVLDDIREGTGYEDLATDLDRLAALFGFHAEELAKDTVHYNPEDAYRAKYIDRLIMETLDQQHKESVEYWEDMAKRVWTLLKLHYGEVQQSAVWLHRGQPNLENRFPSLFAL